MTLENTTNAMVPKISVLIPAYNEELLIGRVIEAVYASFAAIDYKGWEIIVCDNNSTDRTAAMAIKNGAQVVNEPHNQIARARNTAAKSAKGKWLIFIDADTYMTRGILGKTIAAFEGEKSAPEDAI